MNLIRWFAWKFVTRLLFAEIAALLIAVLVKSGAVTWHVLV